MRKLAVITAVAALMICAACDSKHPETVVAAAPPHPVPAEEPRAPEVYQASGPLVVENQVDVAAQRAGIVARLLADAGQRVSKGQLLAQLDDRQLMAERDAAAADVKAYEANLNNWMAETKVLESDYSRDQQLWKYQLITAQQLDHSKLKVDAAKFQITRDQENVVFAKAKLRAAEAELEKTRIVAPFAGVVARRYVRQGQDVAANDRIFWVTETAPMRVDFTLPQEFVGHLKVGDTVQVNAAGAAERHAAKVTLVSPVVDPSSGMFEVRAQLSGKPENLLPGMTVNVQLTRPR